MLLALTGPALASPVPIAAAVTATARAAAQPTPKPLAPVIINGVLFRAVEFATDKIIWRNLAITVAPDHIEAWRALPIADKNKYAEGLIESYRLGMKFDRNIKLTFIDESNATLDQYLWTPPLAERK